MDGDTQVYAVLGDPVRHSLSPPMHNAAFREAGLNAVMVALHVPGPRLKEALGGLLAAGVRGVNLTTPHKERAVGLVHALTPEAAEATAVNTLRRAEGGWMGHATDGIGFRRWLEDSRIDAAGCRAVVLGAGGAARSILPPLLALGPAEVLVVSRERKRAQALASAQKGRGTDPRAPEKPRAPTRAAALGDADEARTRPGWELLIRCLPIPEITSEEERWWSALAPGARVLDLNYTDRAAPARERARIGSLRYEDGLTLLVNQGAASFEFWTGRSPSIEAMRAAVHDSA